MHIRCDSFLQEFPVWEVKTNFYEVGDNTRLEYERTEFQWHLQDDDESGAGIIPTLASIHGPAASV